MDEKKKRLKDLKADRHYPYRTVYDGLRLFHLTLPFDRLRGRLNERAVTTDKKKIIFFICGLKKKLFLHHWTIKKNSYEKDTHHITSRCSNGNDSIC